MIIKNWFKKKNNLDGYVFKTEFTLEDWELADEIDKMFKESTSEKKVEKDEIVSLLKKILKKKNGEAVTEEEILKLPLSKTMELLNNFFLAYMKYKINMITNLNELAKKAKNSLTK